jgi:hypothetical protein
MFVDAAIADEEREEEQATATKSRLRRNLLLNSRQASDQASNKSVREPLQQWRSLKRAAEEWPCKSRKRKASSTKNNNNKLKKIQRKKRETTERRPK